MAEELSNDATESFYNLSFVRQVGLLVGLAISVAIGVSVVLWAQKSEYTVLYASLDSPDAAAVADALSQLSIPYEIQNGTGAIMVPYESVTEAKIKLASQGLPNSNSRGYELLEKKQEFGTSQFMELSRYKRALEGELAMTIASMSNVRAARVHLAIPKEPVFVRDRRRSSASVFVDLYSGRSLQDYQVAAIVNMIASSIPEMQAEDVTVVDQKGNLLSEESADNSIAITSKQLNLKKKIEQDYQQRIIHLLGPILGSSRVRAQVSTDIDFTVKEETTENFIPDENAVRSLQISSDGTGGNGSIVEGIPGALTNIPPNTTGAESSLAGGGGTSGSRSIRETKNYELDKTISHIRTQPWRLKSLSIAVAVDDIVTKDERGQESRKSLTDQEISRIEELVKNAVGFNDKRGDTIEVANVGFIVPDEIEALPEPNILQQPWFFQLLKTVGAAFVVLFLIFGVLKPTLRTLAIQPLASKGNSDGGSNDMLTGLPSSDLLDVSSALPGPGSQYGAQMETVRNMVRDDPGRVAEVVMDWVGEEDGG